MTLRELIRLLASHPADLRVVVNGYESAYDDVSPERVSGAYLLQNTGSKIGKEVTAMSMTSREA